MSGSLVIQSVGPLTMGVTGQEYINMAIPIIGNVLGTVQGLAAGDNTLTPPTGTTVCILVFGSGNPTVTKLKGAAGDTGVAVSGVGLSPIQMIGTSAPFILNVAVTPIPSFIAYFL